MRVSVALLISLDVCVGSTLYKSGWQHLWTELTVDKYNHFFNTSIAVPTIESRGGSDSIAKFQYNIKLDIKAYPTFDGELTSWLKFKRSVLALAATHGLFEILDEDYEVPTQPGKDKDLFDAKNTFICSI